MIHMERRNGGRHLIKLPVTMQLGDSENEGSTSDLSPTGVRIKKDHKKVSTQPLCNLEIHLVPGAITTVIAARKVWQDEENEAYEFISPSFSQQMMLERLSANL